MRYRYLLELERIRGTSGAGTKAQGLSTLQRYGLSVPPAVCCTIDAWRSYRDNDTEILPALRSELASLLNPSRRYAVRSSANVEDRLESSFAGQFVTVLDVSGIDNVVDAIVTVWKSATSDDVSSYARKVRGAEEGVQMGVIVQNMVHPEVSGVAFSRNPLTGLNEVVVEAIRGRGDALVQQGVTPDRWVNKWGGWLSRPESSSIPESLIREVVDGVRMIERRFGKPVDLEWAYDGTSLMWLQMREITSIHNVGVYSEKISREMLPGLIKPLIWSVNIPLVNGAWVRILTELIGKNNLDPRSLARQFYCRAYFNMGAFGEIFELLGMPRESLELLMGIDVEGGEKPHFAPTVRTLRHVPRLIGFALKLWTFGPAVERFVREATGELAPFRERSAAALPPQEILATIDRLFAYNRRIAYYNILAPLLMQMYHRAFKKILRKMGVDYERFDMTDGSEEAQELDPNIALARLHREYEGLDETLRFRLGAASYAELQGIDGAGNLRVSLQDFLDRFGHLSNIGVDFSAVPWRETPDLALRMAVTFAPPPPGGPKVRFNELPLRGVRRLWSRFLYERARRFLLYRAQVGSLYTLGYGLFRPYFLLLADELVRRGILAERDDVFYLAHDEIRSLVLDASSPAGCRETVRRRRAEMEELKDVVVPTTIYGETAPPLGHDTENNLKGIPTSRGYFRGPVRVIRGIQEHEKMREGDVLVIPFSDVGLTPLFARAGAVVAESGGILSHSSIIAREYGIPAVVSVPGACRLVDDTMVGVDGYTGCIAILDKEKGEPLQ